uniref:Uncharacterized protein n=1 Tax=Salix viminalis TaxID=40686 RepID=A0A6N2MJD8_SALVM
MDWTPSYQGTFMDYNLDGVFDSLHHALESPVSVFDCYITSNSRDPSYQGTFMDRSLGVLEEIYAIWNIRELQYFLVLPAPFLSFLPWNSEFGIASSINL